MATGKRRHLRQCRAFPMTRHPDPRKGQLSRQMRIGLSLGHILLWLILSPLEAGGTQRSMSGHLGARDTGSLEEG